MQVLTTPDLKFRTMHFLKVLPQWLRYELPRKRSVRLIKCKSVLKPIGAKQCCCCMRLFLSFLLLFFKELHDGIISVISKDFYPTTNLSFSSVVLYNYCKVSFINCFWCCNSKELQVVHNHIIFVQQVRCASSQTSTSR